MVCPLVLGYCRLRLHSIGPFHPPPTLSSLVQMVCQSHPIRTTWEASTQTWTTHGEGHLSPLDIPQHQIRKICVLTKIWFTRHKVRPEGEIMRVPLQRERAQRTAVKFSETHHHNLHQHAILPSRLNQHKRSMENHIDTTLTNHQNILAPAIKHHPTISSTRARMIFEE